MAPLEASDMSLSKPRLFVCVCVAAGGEPGVLGSLSAVIACRKALCSAVGEEARLIELINECRVSHHASHIQGLNCIGNRDGDSHGQILESQGLLRAN